jgi:hypothetical protein
MMGVINNRGDVVVASAMETCVSKLEGKIALVTGTGTELFVDGGLAQV